jgi:hypothetical protein
MSILSGLAKIEWSGLQTRVSGFCGFNPTQGKTYPFTHHSSPLSRTAHGEALGPFGSDSLVPPWNLGVLGWIQLPQEPVSPIPFLFSPSQGILTPSSISLLHGWI